MSWVKPHFDRTQFDGRRLRAVSKDTGITFQDFSRMHVQRREKVQERRLPTPKWAVKDTWLQLLLVVYLEERFYVVPNKALSLMQRLKKARLQAEDYAPRKRQTLDNLLQRYHSIATLEYATMSDENVQEEWAKSNGNQYAINADEARYNLTHYDLHYLEIQIQNLDTDLVLTDRGHAEVIAALVYMYYRLGWDSVTVAEQLGLKSPHVRIVLYRLHNTWRKYLSQSQGRIANGEEDSRENPSSGDGSEGATSPEAFEPLAEFFGGSNGSLS